DARGRGRVRRRGGGVVPAPRRLGLGGPAAGGPATDHAAPRLLAHGPLLPVDPRAVVLSRALLVPVRAAGADRRVQPAHAPVLLRAGQVPGRGPAPGAADPEDPGAVPGATPCNSSGSWSSCTGPTGCRRWSAAPRACWSWCSSSPGW